MRKSHSRFLLAALAVLLLALAIVFLAPPGRFGLRGGARHGAAADSGGSASPSDAATTAHTAKRGARPAGSGVAEEETGNEPLWGVTIPGLVKGDTIYALDIDGQWRSDPENPRHTPRATMGWFLCILGSGSEQRYPSLLRWPAVGQAESPPSVRPATASSAEFLYRGRLRLGAVYRSPQRGGEWGTDALEPRNAAARANLEAMRADPTLGSVRGIVLTADRQPLAGALVRLTQRLDDEDGHPRSVRTVATGAAGEFAFDCVPLVGASVAARAAGWQQSAPLNVCPTRGDAPRVEIVLAPAAVVVGSVTAEGGAPVPFAVVWAERTARASSDNAAPPEPVLAGAAGTYSLASLPPGIYTLTARAPGLAEGMRAGVRVAAGEPPQTVDLVLSAGLAVAGRVVRKENGTKVGVAGATVMAEAYPRRPSPGRGATNAQRQAVTTGADGSFAVTGLLPDSQLTLYASLGFLSTMGAKPLLLDSDSPATPVEMVLPPAGRVVGQVVDMAGTPVTGVEVTVAKYEEPGNRGSVDQTEEMLGDSYPRGRTGADGRFAIENLPQIALYLLQARAPGYATAYSDPVVCGGPNDVVLRLTRGGCVAGRVVEKTTGRPVPGIRVATEIAQGEGLARQILGRETHTVATTTDASGAFRFDGAAPGVYRLRAQGQVAADDGTVRSFRAPLGEEVELHEGATQNVTLRAVAGGTVRGRVVTEGAGEPVPGASVAANGQDNQGLPGPDATTSAADGAFEFRDVWPGSYAFLARCDGYANAESAAGKIAVAEGQTVEGIVLRFTPGWRIHGTVLGPGGEPVPGASLRVDKPRMTAIADADGRFEFRGLPAKPADYVVSVTEGAGPSGEWIGKSDPVSLTAESPDAEVALRLAPGAAISGKVTDTKGQPLPDVRVQCKLPGPDERRAACVATTDEAGQYSLRGLAEGQYSLSSEKAKYQAASIPSVAAAPGHPAEGCDLVMTQVDEDKTAEVTGRLLTRDGQPLTGWVVSAGKGDAGMRALEGGDTGNRTGESGEFTVAGRVGSDSGFTFFRLGAGSPSGAFLDLCVVQASPVEVPEEGWPAPRGFVVDLGHTVRGRLVDSASRRPLSDLTIMVEARYNDSREDGDEPKEDQAAGPYECRVENFAACVRTDAQGRFTATGVPRGKFRLELAGGSLKFASHPEIVCGDEAVADFGDVEVNAPRTATGRLLDSQTRRPLDPAVCGTGAYTCRDAKGERGGGKVTLDDEGRFTLKNLPESLDRLTFTVTGYAPLNVGDLTMPATGDLALGDLLLERGLTLTGTLLCAPDGRPLPKDSYVIVGFSGDGARPPQHVRVKDDTSTFEVAGQWPGIESLTFQTAGYVATKVGTVPEPDAEGHIDLGTVTLETGGRIQGTVVDAQGAPVKRAVVRVKRTQSGDGTQRPTSGDAPANDQGAFSISALEDGIYTVTATADGHAPGFADNVAVTATGDPAQVQIALDAGWTLKGTLADLNGAPVANWIVTARLAGNREWMSGNTASDELGDFSLANLSPEPVSLLIRYDANLPGSDKTRLSAEFTGLPVSPSDEPQVFVLPLGPRLVGRLVDEEGGGVADVRIEVKESGSKSAAPGTGCGLTRLSLTAERATGADGRFSVGPLAVGTAKVAFSGDMIVDTELESVAIGVDAERDLGDVAVQAAGVLVGRFVDLKTGRTVAVDGAGRATVATRSGGGASVPTHLGPGAVSSRFRIASVAADATAVIIEAVGYLPRCVDGFTVAARRETDLGDVTLDPGVALRVRLLDAETGRPYAGATPNSDANAERANDVRVRATAPGPDGQEAWGLSTPPMDEPGVYVFRPAPSNLPQVTLTARGFEPLTIDSLPAPNAKGTIDLGDRQVQLHGAP